MLAAIKKFILSVMVWFVKRLQDFGNLCLFGTEKITTVRSFYSIADKLIDGKTDVNMSQYKGNVVVVTNVASQWGLTKKSYTQFNQLADDYGEKGLKILAFPCNQFGGQEPGSAKEILDFVEKFEVQDKLTFFKKGDVNGEKTREVFSFLKRELPDEEDGASDIRWNFTKFLLDREGKPVKRYGPTTPPFDMKEDIEELLEKGQ